MTSKTISTRFPPFIVNRDQFPDEESFLAIQELARNIEQMRNRVAEAINANRVRVSTANVSNPPTDAELDSEFGTPATVGAGFQAIIDDNGAGANFYVVYSDGANWWYSSMTKAV